MASQPHDSGDAHVPAGKMPHVPQVYDEAANTPSWVPMLGLLLLGLAGTYGVYRVATAEEEAPAEGEITAEGEAAAAEGEGAGTAGEAAPPTPPTPAPVPAAPPPMPPPVPQPMGAGAQQVPGTG